jgi:hypothetical protein
MSSLLDEGFLAYEAVESAATAGGVAEALPVATGSIPGLNQIWDLVEGIGKSIMAKDTSLDAFVNKIMTELQQELSKGVSDQEMIEILRNQSV